MGIAVSTLGFLSQSILTAPRVYYAMARDGLFFESVGRLSKRSAAPVVAIVLQGLAATVIALCAPYEKILNYEVAVDFILFALVATSLFVLRRRDGGTMAAGVHGTPGHPYTTALFVVACVAIVAKHRVGRSGQCVEGLADFTDRHSGVLVLEPAGQECDINIRSTCTGPRPAARPASIWRPAGWARFRCANCRSISRSSKSTAITATGIRR